MSEGTLPGARRDWARANRQIRSILSLVSKRSHSQFADCTQSRALWRVLDRVCRCHIRSMKLYLISAKHGTSTASPPFRIYLVAAPDRAAVDKMLPEGLILGVEGEVDGSIDHPEGVIGWVGSRSPISINGQN